MHVTVLFFGMLKDLVGRSEERLELPEGSRLETVFEHYASQFPRLREMANSVVLAHNQEFADSGALLGEGDEVALMPPVSGGSSDGPNWLASETDEDGSFYALTRDPIDVRALMERIQADEDGAALTFEGVVRNHSNGRATRYLDYECYAPLALKKMCEIGHDVRAEHAVRSVAIVHRLGRLHIRETSVAIVVASPHRKPAYEASLDAINRLKRLVPIWKKEYFEDGEVWVEGEWEESVRGAVGMPR